MNVCVKAVFEELDFAHFAFNVDLVSSRWLRLIDNDLLEDHRDNEDAGENTQAQWLWLREDPSCSVRTTSSRRSIQAISSEDNRKLPWDIFSDI